MFDNTLKLIPETLTYKNKIPGTETMTEIIKIVKQKIKEKLQNINKKFEESFAISINLKNGNTKNIISIVDNFKTNDNPSYFELNPEEYQEYKNDMASLVSKQHEILKFDDIGKVNRGIKEGGEKDYFDNNSESVPILTEDELNDLFIIKTNNTYNNTDLIDYDYDVLQEIINRTETLINYHGGKKSIKRVKKAKYVKKYNGGNNISAKIDKFVKKLKEKINDTVFGVGVNIPQDQIERIERESIDFRSVIKQIADADVLKRNLGKSAANFYDVILANEQGVDRVIKAFCAKKIIEYATKHSEILTTYKNKIESITYSLKSIQYVDIHIYNKIYRPHERFYIYGMQLPHQFDRVCLLGNMYKLNKENIYSIVDLHDCNSGINGGHDMIGKGFGCNPFDRDCELDIWSLAISTANLSKLPVNATYYSIEYKDMSIGTLRTWNAISNIRNIGDKNNKIIIHCLAGAGRTGTAMLYLLMRDSYMIGTNINNTNTYIEQLKIDIAKRYFGFRNIIDFIENKLLSYFTIVDDDDFNYNRHYTKCMLAELFELGEDNENKKYISLFRSRLNYIIVFLARHFKITEFVTYHNRDNKISDKPNWTLIPPTNKYTNGNILELEFEKSYKKTINSWNDYKIEEFMDISGSSKYQEVMSWID